MDLHIKGAIVPNDDAWIYSWLEYECTYPKMVHSAISQCKDNEILNVYINSGGGDVFSGAEIYTALCNYGNVNIHIVGIAGSCASMIAMAGYCEISPVAQIMIHNVSSHASGDYRDMSHSATVLDNATETIANAYVNKTGLDMSTIREMMDNETWLSPQKALELHFVDSIMETSKSENQHNDVSLVASVQNNLLPKAFIDKMNLKRQQATLNLKLLKLKGEIK